MSSATFLVYSCFQKRGSHYLLCTVNFLRFENLLPLSRYFILFYLFFLEFALTHVALISKTVIYRNVNSLYNKVGMFLSVRGCLHQIPLIMERSQRECRPLFNLEKVQPLEYE